MPVAVTPAAAIRYRRLFPDPEGARPLGWFFAEQLLESRADSAFPTNAAGGDEDVNAYLVGLLSAWATGPGSAGIQPGDDPSLLPPDPAMGSRARAEHFRRQADHRLLALGLFDREDLVRRRRGAWWLADGDSRVRAATVARCAYEQAAASLAARAGNEDGRVVVWRKLARRLPDYVHVLQTLARRRLGLGARLADADLARLGFAG
ncbi:MAG TPA: hypothetical protein PLL30_03795 [Candidatus Krumholzibacteria bacterium]|nr:hypothetical protein [Candidatus Krumholzibacteria bacterium]HPD70897.1 hypothetical protein [Candidatus Krumholzibacteria bacterium]HRY39403.1 hypothetical protein [Candidatus Krumholzibacteria bacterium]